MSSSDDSAPLLPLFSSPRSAPAPLGSSAGSSHSSPPLECFVMPPIPPPNCPLRVTRDILGRPQLPHVSDHPLPADHERSRKLTKSRIDVLAKCASCAERAVECEFSECGIPCPPCAVLGIPDCDYTDPYFFVANLAYRRDLYLHDERAILCAAVHDNFLAPAQFDREYERAAAWFYSAAQGAISRFMINSNATAGLVLRGYQHLAESSTDAGLLSRFLTLGHEVRVHPSVLQTVANRLHTIYNALLGDQCLVSVEQCARLFNVRVTDTFTVPVFHCLARAMLLRRPYLPPRYKSATFNSVVQHLSPRLFLPTSAGSVNMSPFDSPRLSASDEDVIRKLYKTVCATRYDDPVDQDAFLVASANSLLHFRPFIASFALNPEFAKCVLTIRSQLKFNYARLGSSPSDVFTALQDFAGEIAIKRQLYRDRIHARTSRARAAEGAATRAERRAALEHAAHVQKQQLPSPDSDSVSIPSRSEDSAVEALSGATKFPPIPVASSGSDPTMAAGPAPVQGLLSPLPVLENLMISLHVSDTPSVPVASPLSPNLSLPDLAPIASRHSRVPLISALGRQRQTILPRPVRGHAVTCNPPNSPNTAVPVQQPLNLARHLLQPNYVADWLASSPPFTAYRARRHKYPGSFKYSKKPKPAPRAPPHKNRKRKRCYYCAASNHLIALCPMREHID
ncbi:hypothetical protein GGX14DRAFT_558275 [Mycena pura]|uniref:Uncharacterized protein n=1 Tax=Mycena pura TaxID=153505 RepID=A0AAD6YKC8_9AGAR|nr:hypothetical protein GGX14DRAFT_558275 [Mycena pura]